MANLPALIDAVLRDLEQARTVGEVKAVDTHTSLFQVSNQS